MLRRFLAPSIFALALASCGSAGTAPLASAPAPASPALEAAPLSQLVAQVDIPYDSFTLPNGLITLVHTDRKAPIVGVTLYYRVGSKSEPRGKTGFAHLFEHLMFGGSENVENFDIPLEGAGSTSTNGSTWYDRTNYVETLPSGALDLALFMESDRMGYLLGAVSQDKLDKQRSVVQNEKRQGDNQPYSLAEYAQAEGLLPVGHPYRHSTIGSMADLDAASLGDVRQWFIDNYGPNNVVLVLAGDIDVASARPKVERWFGAIPRGPQIAGVEAGPVTLAAPVSRDMADQVPVLRLTRNWTGPALTSPDAVPLALGMHVLGGLASSRLDNVLVREQELAVSVSASAQQFEQLSFLQVQMDVKPGVERAVAEAELDAVIAELVEHGPSEAELTRAATQFVSQQIGALERVGGFSGKGATLAEGLLYAGDPAHYKAELEQLAALTPVQVQAALQRWLARPVYSLAVVPGERTEDGATMGGWGDEATAGTPAPDDGSESFAAIVPTSRAAPDIAPVADLDFPAIERATLSNGIPVALIRRTTIPKLQLALGFDAGYAADGAQGAGTQSLMMDLLTEGTETRNAVEIAEQQELLGANISAATGQDRSTVYLSALTANLRPSLALLADVVRNPAFTPEDVARNKDQRLADIAQELASPFGLAQRALGPILYGPAHPYGTVGSNGDAAVVEALTPAALAAAHDAWLQPGKASISVAGDITMAELLPALESAFGDWRGNGAAAPAKAIDAPTPAPRSRLVVIDRPNSPQSVLLLAKLLPVTGTTPGLEALGLADEVLGDGFLSRLNMDLREDKGWTYGIRSGISAPKGTSALTVFTPVQADRTADSIRLIMDNMAAFPATRPVDPVEWQRVTDGNIRGLPNRFETSGQLLGAMLGLQQQERPDDYYDRLATLYRGIDAQAIDRMAARYLTPDNLTVIVVGDREAIDAQLATLEMDIEYLDPGAPAE